MDDKEEKTESLIEKDYCLKLGNEYLYEFTRGKPYTQSSILQAWTTSDLEEAKAMLLIAKKHYDYPENISIVVRTTKVEVVKEIK